MLFPMRRTQCFPVAGFFLAGALFLSFAAAQTTTTPPFDVSSVRQVHLTAKTGEEEGRPSFKMAANGLTFHNSNLRDCIQWAYHVQDAQLSGPEWLNTEKYDIVAKTENPVSEDQLRLMLQRLLSERFKLQLKKENRPVPVYALRVDHRQPALRVSEASAASIHRQAPGFQLVFEKEPLSQLAEMLSTLAFIDRPVVDMTQLSGDYDFTLNLTDAFKAGRTEASDPGVSAFTLLREQLGLKLEPTKAPMEVLVVQHAERVPTEN